MPINVLQAQRRAYEIGRIRTGIQVPTSSGKTRPGKLDVFRFTSRDEHAIRVVAELYGGTPSRWDGAPTDDQWEVITEAREIDVVVPPGPQTVSQWMEMWSGGGCQRRCDGDIEQRSDRPCLCPADQLERSELAAKGRACKPTTRVSLIIPDAPGLGVWRLESHGWHAAHELGGTAELLAAVRVASEMVSAVLRLETRRKVSDGRTAEFVVPVLTMRQTIREVLAAPSSDRLQLDDASRAKEITAQPVAAIESGQQQSVAAGGGCTAQDVAALAEKVTDLGDLTELGRYAHGQGWMGEQVTSRYVPDGNTCELVEVFRTRRDELSTEVGS